MKRYLPAIVAFLLAVAALVPSAPSLPQHGDEKMYIWKAGYYGGTVSRLDTRMGDPADWQDPGWSPFSFWAFEQPLGSHWLYALAMGLTRTQPPALPYSYTDLAYQGPETTIPDTTLPAVRLAACVLAPRIWRRLKIRPACRRRGPGGQRRYASP